MNAIFEASPVELLLGVIAILLALNLMVVLPVLLGDKLAERDARRPPRPARPAAEPGPRQQLDDTPPAPRSPRGFSPLAPRLQEDRMTDPVDTAKDVAAELPEEVEAPSLYYRLTREGTDTTVFGTVSTMLYDRIFGPEGSDPLLEGDPALLPYFKDSDGELVDRVQLQRHMTAFLMQAFGGPKTYTGRQMEAAHRPGHRGRAPAFAIDDLAFDRVIAHVAAVLRVLEVPPAWVTEVAETVEPLRSSVVQAPRVYVEP